MLQFDIDLTINNCAVKFNIDFSVLFGNWQEASVNFDINFDALFAAESNYGYAFLPGIESIGGELTEGYGIGDSTLPALFSSGEGGFYIPPALEYGYATIPALVSSGLVITSNKGDGDAEIPALQAKGGEGDYGEGSGMLGYIVSYGNEGPPKNTIEAINYCYIFSGIVSIADYIIFIDNTGRITDTLAGSKEYIASVINSLSISDTVEVLGVFYVTSGESLSAQFDATSAKKVGDNIRPEVDVTRSVWVVNMDTGATNQYDGYGFNSFFKRESDGKYFGVADDGIYELSGDNDEGFAVPWTIDFGSSDCGVPGRKKFPNIHIDTTNGENMYLKIETEEGVNTYRVEACRRGTTGWRVKVPYNIQGMTPNFTLIAEDEEELAGIEFMPVKLSRRM